MPVIASITFGASVDSIRTVSNSPVNKVRNSLNLAAFAALQMGKLEKIKFDEEAQKNFFFGKWAF
jgi:hypothetical protein